jgi:hypothetical protein
LKLFQPLESGAPLDADGFVLGEPGGTGTGEQLSQAKRMIQLDTKIVTTFNCTVRRHHLHVLAHKLLMR